MTSGILHTYHPTRNLNIFEHTPYPPNTSSTSSSTPPKSILLFVGGLYDNFLQPHYVNDLAALFPLHPTQTWRVMHVQLSSNGRSWGILDIDRDIEEIGLAIRYLRTTLLKHENTNIVLMGHSTGCQDIMRYLTAPNPNDDKRPTRPTIQGAILQAPVSDRDGALHSISEGPEIKKAYDTAMKLALDTPEKDRRETILPWNYTKPVFGPAPISVAQDFFSNDLSDKMLTRTFGAIGRSALLRRSTGDGPRDTQSLLVLMSDSDEHVGPETDQKALLARWKTVMREDTGCMIHGDSAVILNAMHDVGGDDWPSQEARLVVMRKKVLHYLKFVVGGVGADAEEIWHRQGDKVMSMKIGDGRSAEDQVGVLKL